MFKYFKISYTKEYSICVTWNCGSMNKEVKKKLERGRYLKLSREEKATVAKYACENGVANALSHLKMKATMMIILL